MFQHHITFAPSHSVGALNQGTRRGGGKQGVSMLTKERSFTMSKRLARTSMRILAIALVTATLSACGGGGGGGVASTPAPGSGSGGNSGGTGTGGTSGGYSAAVAPPAGYVVTPETMQPIRSANDTPAYRNNYDAYEMMNALYAPDNGWTGKGVTVAIVDEGVNTNGYIAPSSISPLSKDFGTITTASGTTARNVLSDPAYTHGTDVAQIIAASVGNLVGLAPGTSIANLRVDDYNAVTGTSVKTTAAVSNAINYAVTSNIKVINMSLAAQAGFVDQKLVTAVQNVANSGSILIAAAGNDGAANPDNTPYVTTANRNGWLFVGAVDTSNTGYTLSSYSAKAGTMADRYVVAPGDYVNSISGGTTTIISGTSFAAPAVAALAATILQKWPQLTGQQAANVIIATAKDLGAPGVDPIYGNGLVDFKAALSPVNPTLSNGTATVTSLSQSLMVVPQGVSATAFKSALANITILDSFGRDFTGSLASAVIKPEPEKSMRRLTAMATAAQTPISIDDPAHHFEVTGSVGYANLAGTVPADMPQAQFQSAGFEGRYGKVGFSYSYAQAGTSGMAMGLGPAKNGFSAYAPQITTVAGVTMPALKGYRLAVALANGINAGTSANGVSVGLEGNTGNLRLTMLNEQGSVFGTSSYGALALGNGARTVMLEGSKTLQLAKGWYLTGYGSVGYTHLAISPQSLITSASGLVASRFGLVSAADMDGGVLTLGIAQPLTVEHGTANMHISTGYDLNSKSLTYSDIGASLAGDRRFQIVGGYAKPVAGGSLNIGVMHDVSTNTTTGMMTYGIRF